MPPRKRKATTPPADSSAAVTAPRRSGRNAKKVKADESEDEKKPQQTTTKKAAAAPKAKANGAQKKAAAPAKGKGKKAAASKTKSEDTEEEEEEEEEETKKEEEEEEEEEEEKKKPAKGKKAAGGAKKDTSTATKKKSDRDIPIDEGFKTAATVSVAFDENGQPYDVSLNQTNVGNNNNKFYRLQLLEGDKGDEFYAHTRWGRVGDFGQVKTMGPYKDTEAALKEFAKKFKDKTGYNWDDRADAAEGKPGKYTYLHKSYEEEEEEDDGVKKEEEDDEAPEVKSDLAVPVQRLMELIFNENHFNSVLENLGYNQDKLPLGKLGKTTLSKGFEHLKELSSLIKHPSLSQNKYNQTQQQAIEIFTNKYYSTIPHVFGRNRPPMINNNDILQREVAMLDTLTDMEVANAIMKTTSVKAKDAKSVALVDKRYRELRMEEMTPLDPKSTEYQELKNYLINSSGYTHGIRYRIQDIFRIERAGERDRFAKSEFANIKDKNRRLLWHGSRTTNFGGILSQGLRIAPPEAPVNGYAFGKGVYFADISTKSANYCVASSSGGHGCLLLCEVELGNPMYEILTGDYQAEEKSKKANSIATKGIGRTCPQGWKDAGCVHDGLKGVLMPDPAKPPADQKDHPSAYLQYNEYIVYNTAQIQQRYLFRVAM